MNQDERLHAAKQAQRVETMVRSHSGPKRLIPGRQFIEENSERIPFSGCWIWNKSTVGRRYGTLMIDGKPLPAHRFSYQEFIAPIPSGLFVCHRCDVPSCVNPDHLFLGTQSDNMKDCYQKLRRKSYRLPGAQCVNGHLMTAENIYRTKHRNVCRACAADAQRAYKKRKYPDRKNVGGRKSGKLRDPAKRALAFELRASGVSRRIIAERLGVGVSTLGSLFNGKCWGAE